MNFACAFLIITNNRALLPCYGWTELNYRQGLHTNQCGQMCFINSPVARREVLRRLLALHFDIAAREHIGAFPV
jgi:hypothetical protein